MELALFTISHEKLSTFLSQTVTAKLLVHASNLNLKEAKSITEQRRLNTIYITSLRMTLESRCPVSFFLLISIAVVHI